MRPRCFTICLGAFFCGALFMLAGCASISLHEDKRANTKTEFAVKGPRAMVEHTF